ncbi:uncharacterized protein LY89DRAFT_326665 [Mollisia scopiformis]|uniref:Uncharacterized protein n=1 Tax=Mollisia scopiformis TaxID=149040 RepID=A0A132B8T1_MOLSC|nr:uncharacterized protein LY89DRAFT_326665 [Mollisia scopiformis]KUJ08806.1 hypothetical protein LY89DRAFT_326665 [Mollisia scopiformis]
MCHRKKECCDHSLLLFPFLLNNKKPKLCVGSPRSQKKSLCWIGGWCSSCCSLPNKFRAFDLLFLLIKHQPMDQPSSPILSWAPFSGECLNEITLPEIYLQRGTGLSKKAREGSNFSQQRERADTVTLYRIPEMHTRSQIHIHSTHNHIQIRDLAKSAASHRLPHLSRSSSSHQQSSHHHHHPSIFVPYLTLPILPSLSFPIPVRSTCNTTHTTSCYGLTRRTPHPRPSC